jgi:type III restriction enzyme
MLHQIISDKKNLWLQSEDCAIKALIKYIREHGRMREPQIQAIETYLFLKIEGENKPLFQLFEEGFFASDLDLAKININQHAKEYLEENSEAFALFDFARAKFNNQTLLPELEQIILDNPESLDYQQIIKRIFYNVSYADYLLSLPMGSGKTFLMAAFIYLDLYFAQLEPENPHFAHNFLVLIPSGLKSSIVPSLRTIQNFDPAWIIPEPAASELKRLLKFEVLDEQKSAKKSNKARNPNAQKVNLCLPNPFGQVFVVNAEKVILDRVDDSPQTELIEKTEDEADKAANELRNLIGKIPNLSILIDEVHHAATDEVKLRKVVNKWQANGNITTVLGFSGTPYLSKADKIPVNDTSFFKFTQITNTVYYYPLVSGIRTFLKTPQVKVGRNLNRFQIIRESIKDFNDGYGNKKYENGTIAKIAIYCTNIKVLEEEVYPFLTGELGINAQEILRFHKGNKEHPQPESSELEFRSLDMPFSKKKYILLVHIGKEGWDCPSLTAVVLSQKGDSPKNMVLQTSCRCLRQVDKDKDETALIWLNDFNAKTLNEQLKKEQQTSIEEINSLQKVKKQVMVPRFSRMEFLDMPLVDFYQLRVNYQTLVEEEKPEPKKKLDALIKNLDRFKTSALVAVSEIHNLDESSLNIMAQTGYDAANFNSWLHQLAKESMGMIPAKSFQDSASQLGQIFEAITFEKDGIRFWNDLYDTYQINSQIRLAYSQKRTLETESEVIPEHANLLLVDKLNPVELNPKLYPSEEETEKILKMDKAAESTEVDLSAVKAKYEEAKKNLEDMGMGSMMKTYDEFMKDYDHSLAIKSKGQTFHYLPYNFVQSGFEKDLLNATLRIDAFKNAQLEIYYNGERGLTEFVIKCFAKAGKSWKNIGRYTTDFLIIKRKEDKSIHKVLMIESKGTGFKNDPAFLKKKAFVETEFLKQNNEKFGYDRFDFLYLEDGTNINKNIELISSKLTAFFKD